MGNAISLLSLLAWKSRSDILAQNVLGLESGLYDLWNLLACVNILGARWVTARLGTTFFTAISAGVWFKKGTWGACCLQCVWGHLQVKAAEQVVYRRANVIVCKGKNEKKLRQKQTSGNIFYLGLVWWRWAPCIWNLISVCCATFNRK